MLLKTLYQNKYLVLINLFIYFFIYIFLYIIIMATRKTRIFNTIRSYIPSMPRLTTRSRRVAPSSTEVSVQVRLAQRIEELQAIENNITEYTAKYNNERAKALSASRSGDKITAKITAANHLRNSNMFKNHLITTLERQKLNTVRSITEAEIENIQNALKKVTSIDEHQVLLDIIDIIKADIARYRTDYENIASKKEEALSNIKKGDALNAYERRTNEITQKYVNLYTTYKNMYSNHLKSLLEVHKRITEELRNQKATGSETARDASTSRKGGKIMRKSKRRIIRIRKTRRHKI